MLIEEIINEWFGYKGIVSDVMEQYKLRIKEMTLFKENFIFYNIFLFFCLLIVYQLSFNFFKNTCIFIYDNLEIFSLIFICLFFLFFLILKNYIEKQQINSENKFWFYIFLMMTMIVLYPLKYQIKHKIGLLELLILTVIITLTFIIKKVYKKKLLDWSTWRDTWIILLNWNTLIVFVIVMVVLLFNVLLVFLFQIYLIAVYEDKNEEISLKWWIYIMLIIITPLEWEIPITVILFKLLYRRYEEYKKKNKKSNEKNTSIEKYKIFTLNHIFEDFYTNKKKNYNFILKVISYIYSGWMFLQLSNYFLFKLITTVNENKDIKIDYLKITFCVILYLILNMLFSKMKIKKNVFYIIFCVITILWYHLIIRKNIQRLLFFIFLNILIFIVYFFISFIKSNTRKEILKRNMQVRENILMNTISNFENNNDKEYKIEILKSLSLEVNKKIVFLRVVKWGFIIYILFQIISRYLYKYFTFETLSLFEELIKKFFSIQFSPEKIFNESIIFLLFVTGMFIVSQMIEKLLPYKLMELIYLNETINNLLLKEQKKGLNNVKKIRF